MSRSVYSAPRNAAPSTSGTPLLHTPVRITRQERPPCARASWLPLEIVVVFAAFAPHPHRRPRIARSCRDLSIQPLETLRLRFWAPQSTDLPPWRVSPTRTLYFLKKGCVVCSLCLLVFSLCLAVCRVFTGFRIFRVLKVLNTTKRIFLKMGGIYLIVLLF